MNSFPYLISVERGSFVLISLFKKSTSLQGQHTFSKKTLFDCIAVLTRSKAGWGGGGGGEIRFSLVYVPGPDTCTTINSKHIISFSFCAKF